jgi:hypothetical protein
VSNGYPVTKTARSHPFAFTSTILIKAMPTENSATTGRLNAVETEIKSIREKALPLIWKAITIIATLILGVVSFYVFYYAPMQIDNHILRERLEAEKKNPNIGTEVEGLRKTVEALDKKISENIPRLDVAISKLDTKVDNYLIGIASSRPKTHHALRQAVTVKRDHLRKSLPVAREVLQRAEEQGTILSYGEIKQVARATLPLLRREQRGTDIRREVLSTLSQLAEYKTFVDSKNYQPQSSDRNFCPNGQATLGGIPLQDAVFVNCTIQYFGGDIILKNVSFVNCKFSMVDEPDGEKFLRALLLADKPALDVGTFRRDSIPSSSE